MNTSSMSFALVSSLVDICSQFLSRNLLDFLPNILLAVLLGAFLGYERRKGHKVAGVRTHMVIAASSALIALCGVFMTKQANAGDPTRLAAQILAGIGFIGAGVILKNGINTSGVTTAATILFAVGIGIACGFSLYFLAITSTLLIVFSLIVAKKIFHPNDYCHSVRVTCKSDRFAQVRNLFGKRPIEGFVRTSDSVVEFTIQPDLTMSQYEELLERLLADPQVLRVSPMETEK